MKYKFRGFLLVFVLALLFLFPAVVYGAYSQNLATSATYSGASPAAIYNAERLYDGGLNNYAYASTTVNGTWNYYEYIQWDLGTSRAIRKVDLNYYYTHYSTSIYIEYSDNNSNWTRAYTSPTLSDGWKAYNTYDTYQLSTTAGAHRYWRVGWMGCQWICSEMRLYADTDWENGSGGVAQPTQTFNYTGSVQTFTAPVTGTYQLEVWGAQGGNAGYYSYSSATGIGGKGGYSKGEIHLNAGQTISIYVGGQGGSTQGTYVGDYSITVQGGWNGGGAGLQYGMTGGGGATDMRLGGTALANRIIVAGGGGGAGNSGNITQLSSGGEGGGLSGQQMPSNTQYENRTAGLGGTQNSGYALGNGANTKGNNLRGGGGGGYYGGMVGDNSTGGGGGSGYVGGVQNSVMQSGANYGNGRASITSLTPADSTAPQPPTITAANTNWVNATSVSVSITHGTDEAGGSGVDKTEYMLSGATSLGWTTYSGSSFTVTSEGQTTVAARTVDKAGNVSTTPTAVVKIDRGNPTSPTINLSNSNWSSDVTFTITNGTDSVSGVQKSQYKLGSSGTWNDYSSTVSISTEGLTVVYAKTIDNAGNTSSESQATAKVDKTGPTGSISINNGEDKTDKASVTLSISATDVGIGVVSSMAISNDTAFSNPQWENYSTTKSWTLTSGDGAKTVYIKFKDSLGNISGQAYQDIINLDTKPPEVVSTSPANGSTDVSNTLPITVTFSETIQESTEWQQITLVSKDAPNTTVSADVSINGTVITIEPTLKLISTTEYTVKIPKNAVMDMNSCNFEQDYTFSFTTMGPKAVSSSPSDGQKGIDPNNLIIYITFNSDIQKGPDSIYQQIKITNVLDNASVSFNSEVNGSKLTITPVSSWLYLGSTYEVTLPPNCIQDLYGNQLAREYSFTFSTGDDTNPPTITNVTPAENSSINKNTVVQFNVSDDQKIAKVEYMWNDNISGTYQTLSYTQGGLKSATYKTAAPPAGFKELKIRAFDASGNITEKVVKYNYPINKVEMTPTLNTIFYTDFPSESVKVVATYTDGTQSDITKYSTLSTLVFDSSNSNIAYVKNNILYSGKTIGTATITAIYDGKQATCAVTVTGNGKTDFQKPTIVNINPTENSKINKDIEVQFSIQEDVQIKSVRYAWTNGLGGTYESAIFVSGDRATNAVYKVGKPFPGATQLRIEATDASDNQEVKFINYVYEVSSLTITPSNMSIVGNNTLGGALNVQAEYSDFTLGDVTDLFTTGELTFSSSNTDIATVKDRLVFSGSTGTAEITASYKGKIAKCNVSVTQGDKTPPEVAYTNPSDKKTGVEIPTDGTFKILVNFNEVVKTSTNASSLIKLSSDTKPAYIISAFIAQNSAQLEIKPSQLLEPNKLYTVTIPRSAITDLAGNERTQDYTFSFTTASTLTDTTQLIALKEPPKIINLPQSSDTVTLEFVFNKAVEEGEEGEEFKMIQVKLLNAAGKAIGDNLAQPATLVDDYTLRITFTGQTKNKYTVNIPRKAIKARDSNEYFKGYGL